MHTLTSHTTRGTRNYNTTSYQAHIDTDTTTLGTFVHKAYELARTQVLPYLEQELDAQIHQAETFLEAYIANENQRHHFAHIMVHGTNDTRKENIRLINAISGETPATVRCKCPCHKNLKSDWSTLAKYPQRHLPCCPCIIPMAGFIRKNVLGWDSATPETIHLYTMRDNLQEMEWWDPENRNIEHLACGVAGEAARYSITKKLFRRQEDEGIVLDEPLTVPRVVMFDGVGVTDDGDIEIPEIGVSGYVESDDLEGVLGSIGDENQEFSVCVVEPENHSARLVFRTQKEGK